MLLSGSKLIKKAEDGTNPYFKIDKTREKRNVLFFVLTVTKC